MLRAPRRIAAALAALAIGTLALPAQAARPLPDSGKWDRTFALYARDVSVPWKRITVRLDTYSSAPVDFAAYPCDPSDVLVAGKAVARALDTSHRTAAARWRFMPPAGLRYTPNDVDVPLGGREGFFVIEARRGAAVQQAWLDITRIGLLTKESSGGITLYGADLGTGRALSGMRITYLVGRSFAYAKTDVHGIARWTGGERPRFALAEWGGSRAFVSFLPQAPVPATIVSVRTDRSNARAGEHVRVVGFARRRAGAVYRPANGDARITIVAHGRTLASGEAKLDAAGAFSADLQLPADAPAGDAAVLASADGASGGAAMHVDGVGDVALAITAPCTTACPPSAPILVTVVVRRPGGAVVPNRAIRVQVVRSPHVFAPDAREDGAWATTSIVDVTARTDADGLAHVTIPGPADGLASTYGITATSDAATASARLVAPVSHIALAVTADADQVSIGAPAAFDVRGFDATDGRPAGALAVRLRLVHGATEQRQQLVLDANGRARAVFRDLVPGTSLAYADASVDGLTVTDIDSVTAAPSALLAARAASSVEVNVRTDKPRYHVGDHVNVDATLTGAVGDALVSFDGARSLGDSTVSTNAGRATGSFTVPETVGDAEVGVAFVRDGALEYGSTHISIDGDGHARATAITADAATYAPGAVARLSIADDGQRSAATLAIRVSDRQPAGGAAFADAPSALAGIGTTTQDAASTDPAWHASVSPSRSTAIETASSGREQTATVSVGAGAERALAWRIDRADRETFDVTMPTQPGKYVVSVLKIGDDGDVGAASLAVEVR